ncbi:MAG: hypothetical protein HFH62_07735 [Lachnospiraceae bacterium]|nr:hypothetical protein [Lachnospiraceae bacterium]
MQGYLDGMVQEWGSRIEDWYHRNIHDAGSTWRKEDRISFHFLFLSNETEEPMPLLELKNVVLPCGWVML